MKCENCGQEHDGSYGSGRFCSKHCRRVWIGKYSVQKRKQNGTFVSGFAISKTHGKAKTSPYGTWKCSHCGLIFRTRKELQQHVHEKHTRYDKDGKPIIWNKGLKLKDHPSLVKARQTLKDGYKTGRLIACNKGKKHSQDEIQKIRLGTISYLQHQNKSGFQPRYDKKSIAFFDQLSKERGWNLQHAENGGEFYTGIGYFVDAYDKQRNVVVEYDEKFHYDDVENNVLREKDLKRQKQIIDHLHCEFWRYNEAMNILWKVN